jgi:hypothetical protein
MKPTDSTSACEMESSLTMEVEAKFQDVINCKDLLDLDEIIYFSFFM